MPFTCRTALYSDVSSSRTRSWSRWVLEGFLSSNTDRVLSRTNLSRVRWGHRRVRHHGRRFEIYRRSNTWRSHRRWVRHHLRSVGAKSQPPRWVHGAVEPSLDFSQDGTCHGSLTRRRRQSDTSYLLCDDRYVPTNESSSMKLFSERNICRIEVVERTDWVQRPYWGCVRYILIWTACWGILNPWQSILEQRAFVRFICHANLSKYISSDIL